MRIGDNMYLKELKIINFRKFDKTGSSIYFVKNNPITNNEKSEESPSIAHSTTLIIGKNNSGKTTISSCLNKILSESRLSGNDFNYSHISDVLLSYKENQDLSPPLNPYMKFTLRISLSEESESECLYNFKHILDIKSIASGKLDFEISINYKIKDEQFFSDQIRLLISKYKDDDTLFRETLTLLSNTDFKKEIRNSSGIILSNSEFSIRNALELKLINSNFRDEKTDLSNIFNKIIKYKIKKQSELNSSSDEPNQDNNIDRSIIDINNLVKEHISTPHSTFVNKVLHGIIDNGNLAVNLQPELTLDSILKNIITYEYKDRNHFIPESQFGLGYSNLIKIIGEVIDFIEKYEEDQHDGKVNLIFIEEPECFMHPQMQELFIKNIDDAISAILESQEKSINLQLIITTHSPHILNSKIQHSGSFNNINYIKHTSSNSCIIKPLRDSVIILNDTSTIEVPDNNGLNEDEFHFLKKHLKSKCADLFYADAIIMTEGITEETLLHHYIDNDPLLSKKCISIFNINGAFAHIYKPLISFLEIPCLTITDIDIERDDGDKSQVATLDKRKTTNAVLNKYLPKDNIIEELFLNDMLTPIKEDMFYLAYQNEAINGFYPTSFEEALILTNYKNSIVQETLSKIFPKVSKQFSVDQEELKNKSYEWQYRLAKSKSEFANTLLFKMTGQKDLKLLPTLPNYVTSGLSWLSSQLTA
jgi:putative ATP-dependent endonuclease of OLD family